MFYLTKGGAMRKKLFSSICLVTIITMLSTGTVFAKENDSTMEINMARASESEIAQEASEDVLEDTIESLDISEEMTDEALNALDDVANVSVTEKEEGGLKIVEYQISPESPIETTYFRSGNTEEKFHSYAYTYAYQIDSGDKANQSTISTDITLRTEIYYYKYTSQYGHDYAKLYKARGGVVMFRENGLKDFGIASYASGEAQDEYGYGYALQNESNSTNIGVPVVGQMYTLNTPAKYFYQITNFGQIKADTHVQYSHGSNWYSIACTVSEGSFS